MHQYLIKTFAKIDFTENCASCHPSREVRHVWKGVCVQNGDEIQPAVVTAGTPATIRLPYQVERRCLGAAERRIIPSRSRTENSAFIAASFSPTRGQNLDRGPLVMMWCWTPCVAAGNTFDGHTPAGNCSMRCWNTNDGLQVATCETTAADPGGCFYSGSSQGRRRR